MLHILLPRELLMLAIIGALGAGPAALLPGEQRSLVRVALAPALGLALGSVVLVTANLLVPLGASLWFPVLPIAAISLAVALRRAGRADPGLREHVHVLAVVALLAVLAVPLGALNHPFDARLSQGPVGYGIFDGPGYVTLIQGFQDGVNADPLLRTAEIDWPKSKWDDESWGAPWNIALRYGWTYKYQHTSGYTLPAAISGGFGWPPWQVLTPFLIVLVITGALGVMALTLRLTGALVPSVLAGVAYAGPVTSQVLVDGSGALLAGLAILPPLAVTGIVAFERPTLARTLTFGALLAALQAIYPELLALPAAAAAVSVAALGVHRGRRGLSRAYAARGLGHLLLAGAASLALSPRTAPWTLDYLTGQLGDNSILPNLVKYELPARNAVSWIFGVRDFYGFAFDATAQPSLLGEVLLPLLLLAAMIVAVVALSASRPLAAFVIVAVAQAAITAPSLDCSYCAQRSLLALPPIILPLMAAGLTCAARRSRVLAIGAVAVATAALIATGVTDDRVLDRAQAGAYMTSLDHEALADAVKPLEDTVTMEGFDAVPLWAWAEQPTTYMVLDEATDARISAPAAYNDWGGYSYFATRPIGHPVFDPGYRYVASRFGALDSGRRTIGRFGPIKLEERARPFDVTVARGLAVDIRRRDPTGVAYVQAPGNQIGLEQGPLTFWVSAEDRRPAYVHAVFAAPPDFKVGAQLARQRLRADARWDVCVPVPGRGRLRVFSVAVAPTPPPLGAPAVEFENAPQPARTIRLDEVRASVEPCRT